MKSTFIVFTLALSFAIHCSANTADDILTGAYAEVQNGTKYNSEMLETYFPPTFRDGIDTGKSVYPNGDVNPDEGICADLIVRSLRHAGHDLQQLVHQDILSDQKAYGVTKPDKYIDQRRVWILNTYFKRQWKRLSTQLDNPEEWQPGDIVIWDIGSNLHFHIGIIGSKRRSDGFPYVIHNMSYVPMVFAGKTIEQDILYGPALLGMSVANWKVIGHYRVR